MILQELIKRQLKLIKMHGANPGAKIFMVSPNGEDCVVDTMTLEEGNIYLYPEEPMGNENVPDA